MTSGKSLQLWQPLGQQQLLCTSGAQVVTPQNAPGSPGGGQNCCPCSGSRARARSSGAAKSRGHRACGSPSSCSQSVPLCVRVSLPSLVKPVLPQSLGWGRSHHTLQPPLGAPRGSLDQPSLQEGCDGLFLINSMAFQCNGVLFRSSMLYEALNLIIFYFRTLNGLCFTNVRGQIGNVLDTTAGSFI